jgi:subtilisin family serine protease
VDVAQKADLTSDPPTYQGLTGEDIAVAVMDVGVDADHDDFWDHDLVGARTASRVDHHTVGQPISLHGTHVAGIIAGSGYQSARSNAGGVGNGGTTAQWRGMAPKAKIVSFANVNSGGNVAVQYEATVVAGADLSNESHEQEKCLVYDQIAETVDSLVRGTEAWMGETIPRRPAVWGAGNNGQAGSGCQNYGYFGVTVASKNPIVVGATNTNGGLLWEHSSPGPTYDGRLKPDLVAPGCTAGTTAVGLKSSAMSDPDFPYAKSNGYDRNCGTSMATAVVTGIVALLLEKWRGELIVTGDCELASGGECFPLPSTLKAILIQGAMDLSDVLPYANPDTGAPLQYHRGPDYATGYGLVRADASVAIIDAGIVGLNRRVIESEAFATGAPDEYLIEVPNDAQRLRVTLAWDDEPGNDLLADTEPQLKNNLDLELVSPSAGTLLPWIVPALKPNVDAAGEHRPDLPDPIVATNVLAATTGVDDRNNVEQVEVPEPSEGTWVVRVKGGKLPVGSSQEYSLVADYAFGSILAKPAVPAPPTNLCVELDWNRTAGGLQFDFVNRTPCGFIPLEPICRYVVRCPICQLFGVCPEIRLALTDVPEYFRVAVRRADGSTAAADESRARTRTLRWTTVAGEKLGLFFEAAQEGIPAGRQRIGVDLRRR